MVYFKLQPINNIEWWLSNATSDDHSTPDMSNTNQNSSLRTLETFWSMPTGELNTINYLKG